MSNTFLFVKYHLKKWKDIAYLILYGLNPYPLLFSLFLCIETYYFG